MRRTGRMKDTPRVKPVRKIEINENFSKWKIPLIIILFVGGITLTVLAALKMVRVQPGWQTISADGGMTDTCVYDFTLQYLLGETEQKTNEENSAVAELYMTSAAQAHKIFSADTAYENVNNLYYLNHNANQEVSLEPALYSALELMVKEGGRRLYLAPIYENNRALLASLEDYEAEELDPTANEDTKAFYEETLPFVNDPEKVDLKLLGNNKVCLQVSNDYLVYAGKMGIENFVELDWLRNAFIIDYMAEEFIAAGHTNGILVSYDGFTRNLDQTDRSYDVNLLCSGARVATAQYQNVKSFVWLRDYPMSELERLDFYAWEDGRVNHRYLDPADGLQKSVNSDFVGYSRSLGCAEVALKIAPVYIAEGVSGQALAALPGEGVEYVLAGLKNVYVSDKTVTFLNLLNGEPIYEVPGNEE